MSITDRTKITNPPTSSTMMMGLYRQISLINCDRFESIKATLHHAGKKENRLWPGEVAMGKPPFFFFGNIRAVMNSRTPPLD